MCLILLFFFDFNLQVADHKLFTEWVFFPIKLKSRDIFRNEKNVFMSSILENIHEKSEVLVVLFLN